MVNLTTSVGFYSDMPWNSRRSLTQQAEVTGLLQAFEDMPSHTKTDDAQRVLLFNPKGCLRYWLHLRHSHTISALS